jgi:integrase
MKLKTNSASGRIYAHLKTGNPSRPVIKMTLGTKSAAEAGKKAKALKLAQLEAAMQLGPLSQKTIARLQVGKKVNTEQAAAMWLQAAANRDESPATTQKSRMVLDQWFNFAPELRKLAPMFITEAHVSPFINRPDDNVGASTRRRQLSVIRMFLRYCNDTSLSQGNVAGPGRVDVHHRKLSHEQREPKTVLPFTDGEVQRILANTEGWDRWSAGIAAAAGLRLGDIAQLEHASLSVPGHIIVHTDKRGRRVCLPIDEKLTPGLAEMLAEIPPSDSPYLFPEAAAQYEDIKAGRPKFSIYFARILDRIGIDRKGGRKSFHSLRHTALTRWAREGFSLDECKEYAGHSSTKTTSGYIHR